MLSHDFDNIIVSEFLKGNSFAITGKMERKRDDIVAQLTKLGGRFDATVKRTTDMLITGDHVGDGKLTAARKYGTKIISEQDLWDKLTEEDVATSLFMF